MFTVVNRQVSSDRRRCLHRDARSLRWK